MISVFPDTNALMRGAVELFVARAKQAVQAGRRCNVALAGGNTPKQAYELLATKTYRDQVDWDHVYLFWGDERCVPPDDLQSNYRMTREALLDAVPIPAENVHRIRGELSPNDAARDYDASLERHFGADPIRFDLVLLGLGTNGHTASLFPGTPVIHERTRRAAEVYVAELNMWRVTLTVPIIAAAIDVAFLVSGADKADVVHAIILGPRDPERLPAQFIQDARSETRWLVDRAAASRLPESAQQ